MAVGDVVGSEKASWVDKVIFRRAVAADEEAEEKTDDSQFILVLVEAVARVDDDDGLKESADVVHSTPAGHWAVEETGPNAGCSSHA